MMTNIEPLHKATKHVQQRCTATGILRQHCNFSVTPRISVLKETEERASGLFGIMLQDMNGVMPTGLKAPCLQYELPFEKYFDNPAGTLAHMKFNSVVHRDEEQIEFLIDGHEWLLPTGGLSDASANVEYIWDIYLDGDFYGTFRGYSGRNSAGIRIRKPPVRRNAPIVFLKDVEEFDSRYAFSTTVPLSTTDNYGYLPYWVTVTREGEFVDYHVGVHSQITLDKQTGTFVFSYRPSASEDGTLLIYQCVAVFPVKDDVTVDDISTYRLEIKPLERFQGVTSVCPHAAVNKAFCHSLVVKHAHTRSLAVCTMPVIPGQARYYKHVPRYTPPNQMRVTVRPRSNYPLEFGWLRGYGFTESTETRAAWNSSENKVKVVGVKAILTPEMVCPTCDTTGNNAFRSWFDGCNRLHIAELIYHKDWRTVKTEGDRFGYRMFYGCASLPFITGKFTEPQSITACGDYHNYQKFAECSSLQYVSDDYTEPHLIMKTGAAFGAHQFAGCTDLKCVSPFYTEPKEITEGVTDFFNVYKFAGCRCKTPSPQYRESIVRNLGKAYLANKWSDSWK